MAGGALGSTLRYLVGLELESVPMLFAVNLLGAGFLGLINGAGGKSNSKFGSAESKWFWGAGFSGGFTTMSGLALTFVLISSHAGAAEASVFAVSQLLLGVIGYALAFRLSRGSWLGV